MAKTARDILEEFLRKHYLDGLTSCVNIPYEDEALSDLYALLCEGVANQDVDTIRLANKTPDFNYGLNHGFNTANTAWREFLKKELGIK